MTIVDEWVLAGTGSRGLRTASPEVRAHAATQVNNRLGKAFAERGDYLIVMSGMAEGFDHLLAAIALKLGIPLWCAIPNKGYGHHYWHRNSVTGSSQFAEWCRILDSAHRVTYVMEDVHGTSELYLNGLHSNFVRNAWMVEQADDFLVWDPSSKGTAHCVKAIRGAGKWRDDMILPMPELVKP
jgi:hypothetical protein